VGDCQRSVIVARTSRRCKPGTHYGVRGPQPITSNREQDRKGCAKPVDERPTGRCAATNHEPLHTRVFLDMPDLCAKLFSPLAVSPGTYCKFAHVHSASYTRRTNFIVRRTNHADRPQIKAFEARWLVFGALRRVIRGLMHEAERVRFAQCVPKSMTRVELVFRRLFLGQKYTIDASGRTIISAAGENIRPVHHKSAVRSNPDLSCRVHTCRLRHTLGLD